MLLNRATTPWTRKRLGLLLRNNFGSSGGGAAPASFSAFLMNTLVPETALGSSTPTFTRATTAYVEDWEGLLKQAISGESRFRGSRRVQNTLLKTDFSASWTLVSATKTTGVSDPFGGTGAITLTGTLGGGQIYQGITLASSAFEIVNSIYIRRRTGTGAVTLTGGNNVNVTITSAITSSWRRISVPKTTGGNGGGTTYFLNLIMATSGDELDLYLPQMEDVTGQSNQNPSEGVSNGVLAAPFHGAGVDGVKYFKTLNGNTVSSNVVTEATGANITNSNSSYADASGPFGYLSEGSRTNLCLQSQTFDNATWIKETVTVTADNTTAPDGTTTADRLNVGAGATGHRCMQNITIVNTTNVGAVYAKAGTVSWLGLSFEATANQPQGGGAFFDLTNGVVGTVAAGATATISAAGNGWYRCTVAKTAGGTIGYLVTLPCSADNQAYNYNAAGTETIYVWGAQGEQASFASTYIPTTTVAVTRNADALSYASASNFSGTSGALYCEITVSVSLGSVYVMAGTGGGVPLYWRSNNSLGWYDLTNDVAGVAWAPSSSSVSKIGVTYSGAQAKNSVAGSLSSALAFDGDWTTGASVLISTSNQPFGTIRNVRGYTTPLSDSALQAVTS